MTDQLLSKLHEKDQRILLLEIELEQAKERARILQEQVDELKEQVRRLTMTEREKRLEEKINELTEELIKGEICRGEYEWRLNVFEREEDRLAYEETYYSEQS
jgi:hypothetical protein